MQASSTGACKTDKPNKHSLQTTPVTTPPSSPFRTGPFERGIPMNPWRLLNEGGRCAGRRMQLTSDG